AGSTKWWFYFNLIFTIPALAVVSYTAVPRELEHMKHLSEHPNEFIEFPHIRKRKNPFPWGDDSLFHNDNSNPVRSSLLFFPPF
ncbi:hypothetical protein BC829DRAFT_365741, partial [Chytridium lagenaria]